jgi:hypothetical protein
MSGLPQEKIDKIAEVFNRVKQETGADPKPYQVAMEADVAPDTAKRVLVRLGLFKYVPGGRPKVIPGEELQLEKPEKASSLIVPFIDLIDKMLIENIKVMNVTIMKKIREEGYQGEKTTLKTYLKTRRPYIAELKTPPIPFTEKPVKTKKGHELVLEKRFRDIIDQTLRDEHPWYPEKLMMDKLRKEWRGLEGYTGQVTMVGNYIRSSRPILFQELQDAGTFMNTMRKLKADDRLLDRVKTKIYRNLLKDGRITPEELDELGITLKPQAKPAKVKVAKPAPAPKVKKKKKEVTLVEEKISEDGISNNITLVNAFKTEADGALFLSMKEAETHIQILHEEYAIREWCKGNVRDNMSADEVTELLVKALKGARGL